MFLDTFRCLFSVLLSNIILGSFLVLMTSVVTKWCNTNIEMKMNNNHATKQKWTNSGYCDTKKLKKHPHFALLWCKIILIVDYEQSLFFFRFSKGSARALEGWAAKLRQARNEGSSPRSHARGHLHVSGILLDGPRKKRDCL